MLLGQLPKTTTLHYINFWANASKWVSPPDKSTQIGFIFLGPFLVPKKRSYKKMVSNLANQINEKLII